MTLQVPLDELSQTIPDAVLRRGEPGFAAAATTMTGDGAPELVVAPRAAEEVAAAMRFATAAGMPVTVRAGGHSVAGLSTAADGLLLDLRRMSRVEVDPVHRLARIGGGASWGEVARELQHYGLGLTAGDTASVGVGGLSLGGGIGWMVRRHGLAVDSLVSAEAVTAQGRIVRASAGENPGLFWALRGGGGGLGVVVTRFDFAAVPVGEVLFGTVVYALDDPRELLTAWRDRQLDADERLTSALSLIPAGEGRPAVAALGLCVAGADAAAIAGPLRRLGRVVSDDVAERPYADVFAGGEHGEGARFALRSAFLPRLDGVAVEAIAGLFERGGTVLSLRAMGGAVARVSPEATAFAHRDAAAMVVAARPLDGGAADGIPGWDTVRRHGTGSYQNFDSTAAPGSPASTRDRLAEVAAAYDPDGLFRRGSRVAEAAG